MWKGRCVTAVCLPESTLLKLLLVHSSCSKRLYPFPSSWDLIPLALVLVVGLDMF